MPLPEKTPLGVNQSAWHEFIRAEAAKSPCDWLIVSDGSGHQDGFGGSASLVLGVSSSKHPKRYCDETSAKKIEGEFEGPGIRIERAAAYIGTTTESAEFLALLHALEALFTALTAPVHGEGQKAMQARLASNPPCVHWITDRESLALAVFRDPRTNQPIYSRRSTPGLWAWFQFYEKLFRILPLFNKRACNPLHDYTDEVASELRILAKDYHLFRVDDKKTRPLQR